MAKFEEVISLQMEEKVFTRHLTVAEFNRFGLEYEKGEYQM